MRKYKNVNRIYILIGTMIVQLGLGTIYTWSLFNKPLSELHNWPIQSVVLSFSITSFSLAISTLFAGKLQDIFGVRVVIATCAIVLGIGLGVVSVANSLAVLYIFAGIIVGGANGIAYMLSLSNCIAWFPEKKGLISGISIGCYGLSALIFKYINMYLLNRFGVRETFIYWGIITLILVFLGSQFLRDPRIIARIETNRRGNEYSPLQLFKSKEAYLLFIAFFASCLGGLYVIGTAKNIGTALGGLTSNVAANAIVIISIANTLGRFILGSLSDRIQRSKVSAFAFLIIIVSTGVLLFIPLNYSLFLLSVAGIAFAFGGNLTIFPSIVGEYFGLKNHNKNYGIIYQGFGIGGLLGGIIFNILGGFKQTFFVIIVISVIAFFIMLFIKTPKVRI